MSLRFRSLAILVLASTSHSVCGATFTWEPHLDSGRVAAFKLWMPDDAQKIEAVVAIIPGNSGDRPAFMGHRRLTISHDLPPALSSPLTMVLIDALHDATDKPVLLTSDIARLRTEYDVLTGLEKVQGTTWREAPPLLPVEGFTAHLESGADGSWKLRLCAVRELDSQRIDDQVVNLSRDATEWRKQIADGMRKLLIKDAGGAGAWQPPSQSSPRARTCCNRCSQMITATQTF